MSKLTTESTVYVIYIAAAPKRLWAALMSRLTSKRLARNDAEAARLRASVSRTVAGEPPRKVGILGALRRAPLVSADLDLTRPHEAGRNVDL
jgi:hypothetical protein